MISVGDEINADLELASTDHEILPISQLIHGAEALILLFVPYCFGDIVDNSMEQLVLEVNERLDEFNQSDLRVVCITREPPSTARHWVSDRSLGLEVYSDPSLVVTNAMVGSFDLSLHLMSTKGVQLGSFFVCCPAVLIIGGDGKVIHKYVATSPESVQISVDEILQCCGV